MTKKYCPSISLALICSLVLGCARTPVKPERGQIAAPSSLSRSEAREIEMGRQIHQAILSSFQVCTEPRLTGYVTRVGRSIAHEAERKNLSYRFTVLRDNRMYATSAPGGFIYITTGFLNFLHNESELASVLAYEVAALQFRDPRFSAGRRSLHRLAVGSAIVGPVFGQIGLLAAAAVVILNAAVESRTPSQEDRVRRADQKAIRYVLDSGRDPEGYLDLLSRLLNVSPEWRPYFYDYEVMHPVTLPRYQKVLAEFEKLPLEGKNLSANRDRYLTLTKEIR